MTASRLFSPTRTVLVLIGAAALMIMASCGEQSVTPQSSTSGGTTVAKGSEVNSLPRSGKVASAVAPPKAVFGMIWHNTSENRNYIFDGTQWVPHDKSVEEFYAAKEAQAKSAPKIVALAQSEVCVEGDPECTPSGAHGKHGGFACSVCHKVAGRLVFDKSGPAYTQPYNPSNPVPSFNATTKTCSNIACHAIPAGVFSYYTQGSEMDADGYPIPELVTVPYGGSGGASSANWNATVGNCSACHDNPSKYNGAYYPWHSGFHANNQNVGPVGPNACELCHNAPGFPVVSAIAQSDGTKGTSILLPALHGNGIINVNARFRTVCFNCH